MNGPIAEPTDSTVINFWWHLQL